MAKSTNKFLKWLKGSKFVKGAKSYMSKIRAKFNKSKIFGSKGPVRTASRKVVRYAKKYPGRTAAIVAGAGLTGYGIYRYSHRDEKGDDGFNPFIDQALSDNSSIYGPSGELLAGSAFDNRQRQINAKALSRLRDALTQLQAGGTFNSNDEISDYDTVREMHRVVHYFMTFLITHPNEGLFDFSMMSLARVSALARLGVFPDYTPQDDSYFNMARAHAYSVPSESSIDEYVCELAEFISEGGLITMI